MQNSQDQLKAAFHLYLLFCLCRSDRLKWRSSNLQRDGENALRRCFSIRFGRGLNKHFQSHYKCQPMHNSQMCLHDDTQPFAHIMLDVSLIYNPSCHISCNIISLSLRNHFTARLKKYIFSPQCIFLHISHACKHTLEKIKKE